MTISIPITEFKARCLEIIRRVESEGTAVDIVRRGKVVARVSPSAQRPDAGPRPWERLRGRGRLLATPDESVLRDEDFV